MTIRARFGDPIEFVRIATIDDVKAFEGRKPDKQDRERIAETYFVVARYLDNGKEFLADVAFLRATDGWTEIDRARCALPGAIDHAAAIRADNEAAS